MPKTDKEITEQKYTDLMAAYRRIAPSCATQAQAWRRVAESPAPRYYITHYQAYQRMLQMFRGDRKVREMSIYKKRLYESLYDTVIKLSQKREFLNMSLYQITQYAILEPAPSFFVSPTSMPRIFHEMKDVEKNKNRKFATFYKENYIKRKNNDRKQ